MNEPMVMPKIAAAATISVVAPRRIAMLEKASPKTSLIAASMSWEMATVPKRSLPFRYPLYTAAAVMNGIAGEIASIAMAERLLPIKRAIGNALTAKKPATAIPSVKKARLAVLRIASLASVPFVLFSVTSIVIALGTPALHIKKKNVYTV